ncbi:FAD-dependent oxidoreductase [Pseudomaricurvus alkylphenolicus]|uniref:flavin monoamine oxidase family protein n=1 Tax=Pseudomaricurvus alkylphenolicus TaxID=1306991 RepID=UPI0014215509|nr:NAD(P)/FAD-dependent oxidoreductase [Pseudomaricurvus alkylphenolicus]NIB38038.1 FAD-dependent oxidoreductase [Pseudomaricurvus alkylphenolicus]
MKDKTHSEPINLGRRKFVSSAVALGAGATALGGSALASAGAKSEGSCKAPGCDYDVIVVGGGNAGAVAARDSVKNGYKTLLLEARNRLGGRTFSSEIDGVPIELGGTWIHNTQPFVWAEVERYGLEVVETPGAVPDVMHVILENGKRLTLAEDDLVEAAMGWEAYVADARKIIPRPYDILHNREEALRAEKINALAHLDNLKLTPLQRAFNRGFIEAIAHNVAESVSYLEVLRLYLIGGGCLPTFMDTTIRFKLKDGTISLIHKIVEDGRPDLKMSSPVKSIHDLGDRAVVTTLRGESFSCRAVISCLPMNTIVNIDFQPPLPTGVVAAGKERHPGAGLKLYIKVKGDVGNVSTVAPGRPLNFVLTYKQGKDHTLLVAFGADTQALDVYDDNAVEKALDEHLPGTKVLSTMNYDWNNDPYAQGTWATYRPGWLGKYHDQFQKGYGRLFFGSSDHGEGWRGTIDGAIGGGVRAAQKVKQLLG